MPSHPDREQLAAFQAGDGDRRRRSEVEAHLAGCPSCAEVVASVERARRRLAQLEEPQLPAGLHDRLAAAVARETAGVRELPRRPTPWHRRPVAWGAAAALLLAALVVPLLGPSRDQLTTAAGGRAAGGGEAAQEATGRRYQGSPGGSGLPLIRVQGEVSAASVRARLVADPDAKAALGSAAARAATGGTATPPGAEGAAPEPTPSGQGDMYRQGGARSEAPAGAPDLRSCLPAATAAADPAIRPLTPAFYLEGTYRGRPAAVLVTASTGQPGRVDLWVFPRGDCSAPPLATERVR